MNRQDFLHLIGAGAGNAQYLPLACLLRDGRGCAGYYNALLNEGLTDTCVLVNARIIDFHAHQHGDTQPTIANFHDFVEEIVTAYYHAHEQGDADSQGVYGRSIPLTALPFDHITVLYPVARIGELMRRVARENSSLPSFLDFQNKSVVLKLLRTKLW